MTPAQKIYAAELDIKCAASFAGESRAALRYAARYAERHGINVTGDIAALIHHLERLRAKIKKLGRTKLASMRRSEKQKKKGK